MFQEQQLQKIISAIENEHPQAAALLLFSLPPETAGKVIAALPGALAVELAERIYRTGPVSPEILSRLSENFDFPHLDMNRIAGDRNSLILAALSCSGYLRQREVLFELAETFGITLDYDDMRTIEDMAALTKNEINTILDEFETATITRALRTTREEARQKILKSLAPETAAEIQSDLDWGGAVPLKEVAAAAEAILERANDCVESLKKNLNNTADT